VEAREKSTAEKQVVIPAKAGIHFDLVPLDKNSNA